jgi:hypothetical protein
MFFGPPSHIDKKKKTTLYNTYQSKYPKYVDKFQQSKCVA